MEKYYGKDRSLINLWGLKLSDFVHQRFVGMATEKKDPILKNSWEFYDGESYSANVYSMASLMLLTLEGYLGKDVMSEVMRSYFQQWKFKHPTSKDFIAVAEEVSGKDLSWFFNQFLKSPGKLDYAVDRVRSLEVKELEGVFNGKKGSVEEDKDKKDKKQKKIYKNEAVVIRKGEFVFPQEILVVFDNGEEIREQWDGKERWRRFIYFKPYQLRYVQVDPEYKVALDVNFTNNSQFLKPKKIPPLKYALSLMFDFQNILSLVSF